MTCRSSNPARRTLLWAFIVGCATGACAKVRRTFVPNQPPSVLLTAFPVDTTQSQFYVVRAHWLGFDPDGRVDRFEYAVLDAGAAVDTISAWVATGRNEGTFLFRSDRPDSIVLGSTTLSRAHTFVIRAVDDQGAASPPAWRTFFSYTVAPQVRITAPSPESLLVRKLPPSVFIQWTGDDPDGEFSRKPLKYKFKLYSVPELMAVPLNPDRPVEFLRFAPRFSSWDSVGGDTTFKLYTDLVPDREYVFAITGFDEAGGFDPVLTRKTNVLRMRITLAATLGPRITFFNEFMEYAYPSGGYARDESRTVYVEVPAGTPLGWNWFAVATEGALVRRTRWKLDDVVELTDETARSDEGFEAGSPKLLIVDDRRRQPDGFLGAPPNLRLKPPVGLSAATSYSDPLGEHGPPTTSLTCMNPPSRQNTLAIYWGQGGRLLFFGGAVAMATLTGWEKGPTQSLGIGGVAPRARAGTLRLRLPEAPLPGALRVGHAGPPAPAPAGAACGPG